MGLQKMYGDSIAIYWSGVNMSMHTERIKEYFGWLSVYFSKIWLGIAFFLVAVLSFEAGVLQKSLEEPLPIIIAAPNVLPSSAVPERIPTNSNVSAKSADTTPPASLDKAECSFVGSKNSNKYHVPTTRCAKQIKPENRVCFASVDAAKAKGYLPGCLE
jgi:hypothetical protein